MNPEESADLRIREVPRVPFAAAALLKGADWQDGSSYRTENLSQSGALLRGEKPVSVGGSLSFRFDSPEATLQGAGKVVWLRRVQSGPRPDFVMGFRFEQLSEDSASAIGRLLAAKRPSRATLPTVDAEEPPPREEEEEEEEEEEKEDFLASIQSAELHQESIERTPTGEPPASPQGRIVPRDASRQRNRVPLLVATAILVALAVVWVLVRQSPQENTLAELDRLLGSELPEAAQASTPPEAQPDVKQVADSAPGSPLEPETVGEGGAAADAEMALATRLVALERVQVGPGSALRLEADGGLEGIAISSLRLGGDTPRLVVKIPDVVAPESLRALTIASPEVLRMRAGWHETPTGGELHVVFDLTSPDILDEIEVDGAELLVRFLPPR